MAVVIPNGDPPGLTRPGLAVVGDGVATLGSNPIFLPFAQDPWRGLPTPVGSDRRRGVLAHLIGGFIVIDGHARHVVAIADFVQKRLPLELEVVPIVVKEFAKSLV